MVVSPAQKEAARLLRILAKFFEENDPKEIRKMQEMPAWQREIFVARLIDAADEAME
jgi:hypothetical protein